MGVSSLEHHSRPERRRLKKLSKVARVVGGTTWVMGGRTERNIGGVVGLGGMAADEALGKGYTVTMKFKCL